MPEHQHHHDLTTIWGRRLVISMAVNLVIPLIQIAGGIVSGSMSLVSDALHNLTDFTSLAISYAALIIGKRGPTYKHTFGFKRVEILATVISVALLYGAGFYIAVEAWQRIRNPEPIAGGIVIWIALLGFAGNLASAMMLHSGSRINLNMKSAFLHMLTDAATSLIVAALGILWLFKPWYWLDPLFSWLIVAMILYSGWGLLKESILILMNAKPPGIHLEDIQQKLTSIAGIIDIHDLHVWNPSSQSIALAVHITVPDQMLSSVDTLAENVREILLAEFNIDHPVLQFEAVSCNEGQLLCTVPRNMHHNHP